MQMQTDRRALLGMMALAPAMAMPAARVSAAGTGDLHELIAEFHKAEAVANAAGERHQAALDSFGPAADAVPHYTTVSGYESKGHGFVHMTTADRYQPGTARSMVEIWAGKEWADDAYLVTCRELIDADDRREAEIASLRIAHGVEAASEEEYRLSALAGDALWAVYEYEASTPAELLAKLDFIDKHGSGADLTDILADDIRRVLKGRLS